MLNPLGFLVSNSNSIRFRFHNKNNDFKKIKITIKKESKYK